MPVVACPWCGENGNIPDQILGRKIRCQKCNTSFVAGATSSTESGPFAKPTGSTIEIEALDPSIWVAPTVAVAVEPRVEPSTLESSSEPAPSEPVEAPTRQYKVLTSKDRWFEGKFELARLEECLNHYARQGWSVRGMATPHVTGFSGGPREELVILMER